MLDKATEREEETWLSPYMSKHVPERAEDDMGEIEKAFSKFYLENRQKAVSKMSECIATCVAKNTSSSTGTLRTAEDHTWFFSDLEPKWCDPCTVRSFLVGGYTNYDNSALVSHPLKGHALMYTQFASEAIVICLPKEVLKEFDNLTAWLEDSGSDVLQRYHAWYAHEGDSIFFPYGTMPLVVGVPPVPKLSAPRPDLPKDGKTRHGAIQKHRFAYALSPLYNKAGPVDTDIEFNRLVKSWLVKAEEQLPESFVTNAEVHAWRDRLVAKPTTAASGQ